MCIRDSRNPSGHKWRAIHAAKGFEESAFIDDSGGDVEPKFARFVFRCADHSMGKAARDRLLHKRALAADGLTPSRCAGGPRFGTRTETACLMISAQLSCRLVVVLGMRAQRSVGG